jgi:hypothetical protein
VVGAIDAVCDVVERIIGKLKDGATAGGLPSLGAAAGSSGSPKVAAPPCRISLRVGFNYPPHSFLSDKFSTLLHLRYNALFV